MNMTHIYSNMLMVQIKMGLGKDYLINAALGTSDNISFSSGGAGSSSGAAAAAPAAAPAKKDTFDVKLKAVDAKAKIKVIKEIRTITGLGLKEVRRSSCIYVLA
jgi:hypothetical protein